ncbi:MAG: hypothetical protein ACREMZ_17630, partial [Gemmatimonadales bacterium]
AGAVHRERGRAAATPERGLVLLRGAERRAARGGLIETDAAAPPPPAACLLSGHSHLGGD